jgi:hypothetical protein
MSDKPLWFHDLPSIIERLRTLPAPVLSRAMIEKEFGLGRRQAIYLMHKIGGWQAGRTFLVERLRLIEWLESQRASVAYSAGERRRLRLEESLSEARRIFVARQVRIGAATLPSHEGLPDGVQVSPGEMRIAFSGVEDLLSKLFELSKAIASDYDEFCRRFVPE